MKRVIIGSFLVGVMTILLLLDVGSMPVFSLIWAGIIWFGLSIWLIISGIKSLKAKGNS